LELGITVEKRVNLDLKSVVRDPTGKIVPAKVEVRGEEAHLEFVPKEPGSYKGELYNGPLKVANVPILVNAAPIPTAVVDQAHL
jgi:hypothetical protein